jgi:hypothetical protein
MTEEEKARLATALSMLSLGELLALKEILDTGALGAGLPTGRPADAAPIKACPNADGPTPRQSGDGRGL